MSPLPLNYIASNPSSSSTNDQNNSDPDVKKTAQNDKPIGSMNKTEGTGLEGSGLFESSTETDTAISTENNTLLEKLKSSEVITPEEIIPIPAAYKETPDQVSAPDSIIQEHIVDKTKEPTKTHQLEVTTDKLTKEADKDEEHFIEEVEKRHGHI